jgi:hypothetical protein
MGRFQKKHRKITLTTKGELNPVYGKIYSKETKEYTYSLNIGKISSQKPRNYYQILTAYQNVKHCRKKFSKDLKKNDQTKYS